MFASEDRGERIKNENSSNREKKYGNRKQKLESRQKRDKVGVNNFPTIFGIMILINSLPIAKLISMRKYICKINTSTHTYIYIYKNKLKTMLASFISPCDSCQFYNHAFIPENSQQLALMEEES